jgi:hypothetical protein
MREGNCFGCETDALHLSWRIIPFDRETGKPRFSSFQIVCKFATLDFKFKKVFNDLIIITKLSLFVHFLSKALLSIENYDFNWRFGPRSIWIWARKANSRFYIKIKIYILGLSRMFIKESWLCWSIEKLNLPFSQIKSN